MPNSKKTNFPKLQNNSDRKVTKQSKSDDDLMDSRCSWLIMCATFLINAIVFGIIRSSGVILIGIQQNYGIDRGHLAVISGTAFGCFYASIICGATLIHYIGFRKTSSIGAGIMFVGTFASHFSLDIRYLTITSGVILGLGSGLCSLPSLAIVPRFFKIHLAKASGISLAGNGVGTLVFPPLIEYLIETYTVRGMFLILSGICLHNFIFASFFRSPPEVITTLKSSSDEISDRHTRPAFVKELTPEAVISNESKVNKESVSTVNTKERWRKLTEAQIEAQIKNSNEQISYGNTNLASVEEVGSNGEAVITNESKVSNNSSSTVISKGSCHKSVETQTTNCHDDEISIGHTNLAFVEEMRPNGEAVIINESKVNKDSASAVNTKERWRKLTEDQIEAQVKNSNDEISYGNISVASVEEMRPNGEAVIINESKVNKDSASDSVNTKERWRKLTEPQIEAQIKNSNEEIGYGNTNLASVEEMGSNGEAVIANESKVSNNSSSTVISKGSCHKSVETQTTNCHDDEISIGHTNLAFVEEMRPNGEAVITEAVITNESKVSNNSSSKVNSVETTNSNDEISYGHTNLACVEEMRSNGEDVITNESKVRNDSSYKPAETQNSFEAVFSKTLGQLLHLLKSALKKNISYFKNIFFVNLLIIFLFVNVYVTLYSISIPDIGFRSGGTILKGAFLMTITSIADVISRGLTGFFIDGRYINLSVSYGLSALLLGIGTMLFGIFENGTYTVHTILGIVGGYSYASLVVHFNVVASHYVGPTSIPILLSFSSIMIVIPVFSVAELIKYFLHNFNGYANFYYIVSGLIYFSSAFWILNGIREIATVWLQARKTDVCENPSVP